VLLKNSLVIGSGERYGVVYSIHPWLDHHIATFEQVCHKLGYSMNTPELVSEKIEKISDGRRKVVTTVIPQILPVNDGLRL